MHAYAETNMSCMEGWDIMTEKERYMISGMDRLLRKFNKYPNDKEFTVEEIIKASNDVYKEVWYYGMA